MAAAAAVVMAALQRSSHLISDCVGDVVGGGDPDTISLKVYLPSSSGPRAICRAGAAAARRRLRASFPLHSFLPPAYEIAISTRHAALPRHTCVRWWAPRRTSCSNAEFGRHAAAAAAAGRPPRRRANKLNCSTAHCREMAVGR